MITQEKGGKTLEPRFRVMLVTGRYPGYKKMEFHLFHNELPQEELEKLVVYSDLSDDHGPYSQSSVERTFSQAEVDQMRKYFREKYESDKLIITKAKPPKHNSKGDGARTVGGCDDFYTFYKADGYDLPFKVVGYFRRDIKEKRNANMSKPFDRTHFAIKYNNCAANGICPICGERTNPTVGLELFEADSWQEICRTCGEKFAPELMLSLSVYEKKVFLHSIFAGVNKMLAEDQKEDKATPAPGDIPI